MIPRFSSAHHRAWFAAALVVLASAARADVVTDTNARSAEIASTVKSTPVAVRTMAIVQVSVHDAVQSITKRGAPIIAQTTAPGDASVDAAVAAATHTALLALVPAQRETIDAAYQTALAAIADGKPRTDGITAGERAALAVLAERAGDGADAPETYVPRAEPGKYVPTTRPLVPHWGKRKPWFMSAGNQVRPSPPPALDSNTWKRDIAEVAAVGGKTSTRRTPEQTAMARFWETTSPAVYWPVVRSVAAARCADTSESARLLAYAAMAMDDALIAVFDAKYAYEFWRPITAIRNGSAGVSDPAWEPFVETPMHPEYPCAHCIVSATIGTLLEAWIGNGPSPLLRSTSPTGTAERTWKSPAEFVQEVSEARICAGVHYRNSTEVGQAMGRQIGRMASERRNIAER